MAEKRDVILTPCSSASGLVTAVDNTMLVSSSRRPAPVNRLSLPWAPGFAIKNKIKLVERKFSKNELYNAKEVFLTSATSFVTPIVKIDNSSINNGLIGELSCSLRELYLKAMKTSN